MYVRIKLHFYKKKRVTFVTTFDDSCDLEIELFIFFIYLLFDYQLFRDPPCDYHVKIKQKKNTVKYQYILRE